MTLQSFSLKQFSDENVRRHYIRNQLQLSSLKFDDILTRF